MTPRPLVLVTLALAALACSGPEEVECSPRTCEAFSRNCGPLADGCGNTLDCGTCAEGMECSRVGVCRAPCTPKTCEELGKNCGFTPDGCDLSVFCGVCEGSEICGAGGEANVCGEPPDACSAGVWAGFGQDYVHRTCLYCHNEYETLQGLRSVDRRTLRFAIESGQMPENREIPDREREWMLDWIDCGLPE